jgi:pyruvate/2-oxoacid:ferredoxin oxidoreductase beta subunit
MPFCKGCGHTHAVRKLNEALTQANIRPQDLCIVSDIGCIGLVDALFDTIHTVHTTHGRSTAFATGIELADCVSADSKLKTVVFIGDGGAMIGLLHLVQAALLNVDVTVFLCNNFLFGMTGGQHSSFSPIEFITPTTPAGNFIPPLDICNVMLDAHAGFVARKLATDKDLTEVIAEAIAHPGFALVEIVELCTEHGTTRNELSGKTLQKILEQHGQQTGILKNRKERDEFGKIYSAKFPKKKKEKTESVSESIQFFYQHHLKEKIGILLAGSAGEKVQSAAGMFCESAIHAQLHCTQKNDNPVTQGSGFSLAEICLSPTEIFYTGIDDPDAVLVVSADGVRELQGKNIFASLPSSSVLFADETLELPETQAKIFRIPFRKLCKADKAASGALFAFLSATQIFSPDIFLQLLQKKSRSESDFFSQEFFEIAQRGRCFSEKYSEIK